MKEEVIMGRLKSGDRQALEDLYRLFHDRVFQAAFFVIRDYSLAEDVTHDVFLKTLDRIGQVRESASLGGWLCRMAVNEACSMLRQRSRCVPLAGYEEHAEERSLSPEQSLVEKEDGEAVKQLVLRLAPGYRQVVYLKYYEEMPLAEIAAALEIPAGSVKARLYHARQQIRKILQPEPCPEHHMIDGHKTGG